MQCDATTPYFHDYDAITHALRCPVCEGQLIASSDAPFALSVKKDICTALHEGKTRAEVIAYVEDAYGSGLRPLEDEQGGVLPMVGILVLCALLALLLMRTLIAPRIKQ